MQIGATNSVQFVASDYLYPFRSDLTVGASGLAAGRAVADSYGDWTVTARWDGGPVGFQATLGHGLPFVFFRIAGGDALVTPGQGATVWANQGNVLGLTIGGNALRRLRPGWRDVDRHERAPLDAGRPGLSLGRAPARRAPRDARAVPPPRLRLRRQQPGGVELRRGLLPGHVDVRVHDRGEGDRSGPLVGDPDRALPAPVAGQHDARRPGSPTGRLGARCASSRAAPSRRARAFKGVLPALPGRGEVNPADLRALVEQAARETLPVGPSYENGKAMSRFAHLVHIADQVGATAARDHFLAEIKTRLEEWFTAGGAQEYVYDATGTR